MQKAQPSQRQEDQIPTGLAELHTPSEVASAAQSTTAMPSLEDCSLPPAPVTSRAISDIIASERARLGLPQHATQNRIASEDSLDLAVGRAVSKITPLAIKIACTGSGVLHASTIECDLREIPFEKWTFGRRAFLLPVAIPLNVIGNILWRSSGGTHLFPLLAEIKARYLDPEITSTTSPALQRFLSELNRLKLKADIVRDGPSIKIRPILSDENLSSASPKV